MKKQRQTKQPRIYYIKWIADIYGEHKLYVLILLFLTIFTTAVTALYPLVYKYIIDRVTENMTLFEEGRLSIEQALAERNSLILILLVFGVAMVLTNIYPYMRGQLNLLFEISLRKKFFEKIVNKSYRFFQKYRTGDIATRLTDDLSTYPPGISWFLCSGIFRAINSSCIILFCLVSMLILNPLLTVLSLIPIPLMLFVFFKLESVVEEKFSLFRKSVSNTNDFLESAYSGIKILKSFNAEPHQKKLFGERLEKRKKIETDVMAIQGMFSIYFEFLNYLGQVFVLLFGGIMVIRGDITLGTYIAFYAYLGMIVWPLLDIPQFFVTGTQACVTIDRLDEISNFEPDYQDVEEDKASFEAFSSLAVENLNFAFEKDKDQGFALENLSFEVKRGERVAIVGKIGSGKTTLLNLLTGIYQPQSGHIRINEKDLSDYNKDSYRKKLGYIEQLPLVLSENVYTNIDFWRELGDKRISMGAKTSQFMTEVEHMPEGFETTLGQRGIGLSGGQKQRLSIARALSGKPKLLIMDDVTSALDAENEKQFWNDLFEAKMDLTSIIVTHRMSTARSADRIIVLDEGRIEAEGTHEELLKISPTYRELMK